MEGHPRHLLARPDSDPMHATKELGVRRLYCIVTLLSSRERCPPQETAQKQKRSLQGLPGRIRGSHTGPAPRKLPRRRKFFNIPLKRTPKRADPRLLGSHEAVVFSEPQTKRRQHGDVLQRKSCTPWHHPAPQPQDSGELDSHEMYSKMQYMT